uniref:Uncharacterized protein n=1 Tax=Salvator merianae TaxID=96440 RepID=A0A8D0BBT3_SALMN
FCAIFKLRNCAKVHLQRSRNCHHMEQTSKIVLSLSPSEFTELQDGINFLKNKSDGKSYILYKDKTTVRACKNMCKHQGGLFIKDIEDLTKK